MPSLASQWMLFFRVWAFGVAFIGVVDATELQRPSSTEDVAQLLRKADGAESSDIGEFTILMRQLNSKDLKLTEQQIIYRRYLQVMQITFRGDFQTAIPLMKALAEQTINPVIAIRASATEIDLLVTQSRFQEAFERLNPLLETLPKITENRIRIQALTVASQLYLEAGQYDLSTNYADQILKESTSRKSTCIGWYFKMDALLKGGQLQTVSKQIPLANAACRSAGTILIAEMFKTVVAKLDVLQGRPIDAINLLESNYADAQRTLFPPVISDYEELLAQAYWKVGDVGQASRHALRVIANNKGLEGIYAESTAVAYKVLYLVEKQEGNLSAALAYHEKYMGADKGYLNEVSAKALAFQIIKQQVLAKKIQIEKLDKQNQILILQQSLNRKTVETTRLYVLLLLLVLASIAWWTYRLKRSQISFRKLARRDGLTGILNRQHFVEEAQQRLAYCQKSARDACLILIDLDHFKHVNDTHGHAMGDQVLKRAVASCQQYLRSTDVFGRLGGEEFAILLPECSLQQVSSRVELLRAAIAAAPADETQSISVSASFGVATSAGSGYELRQLLIHADDALYQAKHAGRNRAIIFDATEGMRHDQAMRKARQDAAAAAAAEPGGGPAA